MPHLEEEQYMEENIKVEKTDKANPISLVLKGMAMGMAEVVPGVSGGTIALITGIYKELIGTITAFNLSLIGIFKEDGVQGLWKAINGNFLVFLLGGMLLGIGIGVVGISYLLDLFPEPLWGFFFGLILASVVYVFRRISKIKWLEIVLFIMGTLFAYAITTINPGVGNTNLIFVFFCGTIAISALILPGISGSFILLLLGMYTVIVPGLRKLLTDFDSETFIIITVFALGCLTGLLIFSRVLSYIFKRFPDPTFAILSGFMLGSLNKIWPWRHPTMLLKKEGGIQIPIKDLSSYQTSEHFKVIQEHNVLPAEYYSSPRTLLVVGAFLFGMLLVYLLSRIED